MDTEQWIPVAGWEGLYEVSNLGRVRSVDRTDGLGRQRKGKVLRGRDNGEGYWQVQLSSPKQRRNVRLNRLTALHFIPNPDNLPQVGHRNHDRTDNRVQNLYWTTARENTLATYRENGRQARQKRRPIMEIPVDGPPVKHPSVGAAARSVGGTHSAIYKAATGGWRSQGRLWRFLD